MVHFLETEHILNGKAVIVHYIVVETSVDYAQVSYVQHWIMWSSKYRLYAIFAREHISIHLSVIVMSHQFTS
jgi:hypothetical protein